MSERRKIVLILSTMLIIMAMITSCTGQKGSSKTSFASLIVTAEDGIDLAEVRVEWVSPSLEHIPVFAEGKVVEAALPESKKDVFDVYVGNRIIGGGGIVRSSAKSENEFHFHISKQRRAYLLDLRVSGPDSANGYFLKRYVRDRLGNVSRVVYYNIHGWVSHETTSVRDINGELKSNTRLDYAYDEKGRKIRQEHTATSPEGTITTRVINTYMYDEQDREIEVTFKSLDAEGEVVNSNLNRFTYDKKDRLLRKEFISYQPDGTIASHKFTQYYYDERDLVVAEELYDENNVKLNRIEREYGEDKAVVREVFIMYNPDGSEKSRHGAEYDEKGVIINEF